jgi:primosomal protein N''
MNSELKKLTSKVQKLHESAKAGKNKTAYNLFKEAMAEVMQLEGNGHKSKYTKAIKAILAEYYNKYQSTVKKDTTRVIVEGKTEDAAKKAEEKHHNENQATLKAFLKEIVSNVSGMKGAISSVNYELVNFHADQLIKIASKIKAINNEEINDFLE